MHDMNLSVLFFNLRRVWQVYREVYKGERNASFASTLHNLGMAFRAMAEESSKLERIPLLERAAEAFDRCVQIREKVRERTVTSLAHAGSFVVVVILIFFRLCRSPIPIAVIYGGGGKVRKKCL